MNKQSTWVNALCALAITLGAMGMAGSAFGMVSVLFAGQLQESLQKFQPPGGTPQGDLARKMQEEMQAATDSMKAINIALAALNFFVSGALLVGGILALRLRPSGRSLLVGTCIVAMVLDLGVLAANVVTTYRASEVQGRYMQEIIKSESTGKNPMPPGVSNVMAASAKVGMMIGLVMGLGWLVAKLAVYVSTFILFRKPQVRSLFAEEPLFASGPGNASGDDFADLEDFGN